MSAPRLQAKALLQLNEGWIKGIETNSGDKYLGLPYAQAPIKKLRWKAPRPPIAWTGIRNASQFGAACPQIGTIFGTNNKRDLDKYMGSEDCLFLNIWRPRNTSARATALPVVIFIHGGSNSVGQGGLVFYDGERLAKETQSIVVTVNYRMGFLGAIELDQLKTGNALDDSGNFTTLDLVQALDFIRKNASALGADREKITIMGQSAGCMNVWGLIQTPLAADHFQNAICMSGLPNAYPPAVAKLNSESFIAKLLLADRKISSLDDADNFIKTKDESFLKKYLYSVSAETLVEAADTVIPIQHIADGTVIPAGGLLDVALGKFNRLNLVLGSVDDESGLILLFPALGRQQTHFWEQANSLNPNLNISDIVKPLTWAGIEASAVPADLTIHNGIDRVADLATHYLPKVYRYHFVWKNTPEPWQSMLGSFHGIDIPFWFGDFVTDQESTMRFAWTKKNKSDREELHRRMVAKLRSFVWTGDMNALDPEGEPWQLWKPLSFSKQTMYWD